MEYVKDDLGYNEIGGVYVKKQGGGWKLIDTDADAIRLGQGMSNGSYLDLYVDTVIDKSIEPLSQTQPHVIVRPRTSFFEGVDSQVKRKFVTVQDLKQQQVEKNKLARDAYELEKKRNTEKKPADQQSNRKRKKESENEKKNASEPQEKMKSTEKEKADHLTQNEKEKESGTEKVADYELKRRMRVEEVRKEAERLKLKEKAADLAEAANLKKNKRKKVVEEKKKVLKEKEVTVKRVTRSSVNNVEKAADGENIPPVLPHPIRPPPPPLPVDLTMLIRVPNNQGIGTMDTYLSMQAEKKRGVKKQKTNDKAATIVEGHQGANAPIIESVFETGESSNKNQRRRGPTKMNHVFTRKLEDRPVVSLNSDFQPYSRKDKVVTELGCFLGTITRLYIPLDFVNWSKVPEEEKTGWWEYVRTKYIIPDEGKDWVLRTLDDNWRVYKSRIKSRCFKKFNNDRDRIKSKPANIPLEQFMALLRYWNDDFVEEKAGKNIANRKKVIDTHTVGRKSFAQLRSELKIAQLDGEGSAKRELYTKTREGHKKKEKEKEKEKENDENLEERPSDHDEDEAEIDFEAHGPNWLVGRIGRTRKSAKKQPENIGHTDSADLEKMRKEIAAEMDDKMNKKLGKILGRLAEMNPTLNVNVEELCGQTDGSDDEDDGKEGEGSASDKDDDEVGDGDGSANYGDDEIGSDDGDGSA